MGRQRGRLDRTGALAILSLCNIKPDSDFHTLNSTQVDALSREAHTFGYRKPREANGSTARHFHAYVERARKSKPYYGKR